MSVDWNQAPEAATHALEGKSSDNFYRFQDDQWQLWCGGDWVRSVDWDGWYSEPPCFIERPDPWSGKGLPPAGTVCEFQNSVGSWVAVEVTAIARKGICLAQLGRDGESYVCQVTSKFRPIRTPEQIAAEEREQELNRMVATISMLDKGWARKVCAGLYDAGYRKQVAP